MADCTFKNCLDAIVTIIDGLSLDGMDEAKVRRMPHDGEHYWPGITVHPVTEKFDTGTNKTEHVGYGCQITMVLNCDNDDDFQINRVLSWREAIRKKFVEDPTLGSVTGVYRMTVEHGHVFQWDDLVDKNYDVSSLIIRVWVEETRT